MSYSFNVQKDLPLITWKLDDSNISQGQAIAQDGYLSTFPKTSTTTNGVYKATATNKSFPIINGESKSVYVTQNGTDSCALQVPAMGFATGKYRSQPMTLEFWIKPKTTLSSSTVEKIVGKPNSETGIYVHNSSFIGIIGDTRGSTAKVVVPVDNMSKPFHIAFVYRQDSVSLIVNGIAKTTSFNGNLISSGYSIQNDVFRFFDIGLDYAVDNISIYAYPMTMLTARRHMVYGLGYQIPDSVAGNFGGFRYNISLAQSKFDGVVQKYNGTSWMNNAESSNLVIEKDHLRINNFKQPSMKYAVDKTSSVFSWNATLGLQAAAGGIVEINPQRYGSYVKTSSSDVNPNGSGFAAVFRKSTATNLSLGEIQTLMVLQDPINPEYFLKIYLLGESSGEAIYYEINNDGGTKLGSTITGGINAAFTVGYFFNSTSNEVTIFQHVSGITNGAKTTFENTGLFPISYSAKLRFMCNDIFSEKDEVAKLSDTEIERFEGGLLKVIQLNRNIAAATTGIYAEANARIDNYTAQIENYLDKRFVVKAKGWIRFKVDAKRLAGINNIIGPNRVEWGHDSTEVTVIASPIGQAGGGPYATYNAVDTAYSTYTQLDTDYSAYEQIYEPSESSWFTSETLKNRTAIKEIMGKNVGDTKAVLITMSFDSNDVEENPTMVSYFRLSSLPVEESAGVYTSKITSNGPDIEVTFDSSKKDLYLPDYRETPFFWTEENGGLRVGRTAKIDYDMATNSGTDTSSGLIGISFFINIPEDASNRTILNITDGTNTRTVTYTTSTKKFSTTGVSVFINGIAQSADSSNVITEGVWNHVVILMNTRMLVGLTSNVDITFGSTTNKSDFYLDEIITLDGIVGSITANDVLMINNLYKGTNKISAVTSFTSPDIEFYDSEISNNTEIYQPMIVPISQTRLLTDVDMASVKNLGFIEDTDVNNLKIDFPSINQLVIDGTYIQDNDRILLKNQSTSSRNGIFIATLVYGDASNPSKITKISLVRQTNPPTGSLVYVKDGVTNKGTHWVSTLRNETWVKSSYLKKVDAYVVEGTQNNTDLISKATITI